MATGVDIYIATCRNCSVNQRSRNPRAPLQNFQAGYPGDWAHLDMGPFCEFFKGHKYVLVIVDQFTHWLEMVPLAVQDAESVARAYFEAMWCSLAFHGASTQIKGGILTVKCSKLSALCWKQVKPERLLIGQVPMVRWSDTISWSWNTWDILGNQQWSWDTYLLSLGMSVRSKVNRNTGFTPNFLPLGREVHIQMWCLECRWRWKVTKSQQTMHDNWSKN